jgi:16S rRNA processing protein RimM
LELLTDISKFLFIGKITKTVGLKGSLKIIVLSDFPERFGSHKKIYLVDDKKKYILCSKYTGINEFEIEEFSGVSGKYKIKIKDYDDINDASELVNKFICINETDKKKLCEDEFYYYEFIDVSVYSDNVNLGKVIRVENYGGDDLLLIKTNNNEFFIPLRKEFIQNVNLENKRIDVILMEGLIE